MSMSVHTNVQKKMCQFYLFFKEYIANISLNFKSDVKYFDILHILMYIDLYTDWVYICTILALISKTIYEITKFGNNKMAHCLAPKLYTSDQNFICQDSQNWWFNLAKYFVTLWFQAWSQNSVTSKTLVFQSRRSIQSRYGCQFLVEQKQEI